MKAHLGIPRKGLEMVPTTGMALMTRLTTITLAVAVNMPMPYLSIDQDA